MRILLINPDVADGRGYLSYNDGRLKRLLVNPSMTMPYIASLTPDNHEVIICDEMLGDNIDFDQDVDLVGITVVTQLARRAYQIASSFRQREKKVVLGGSHITLMPEEALEFADTVVVGEAEDVWQQLLFDLQANKLRPIYRRKNLHHLRGLPAPRMDLLNKQYRYLGISMGQVKMSRGCPYACVTCCVPELYGSRYRLRPLDEVLCEIEGLAEDVIYFCEDNIVGNHRYAKELFRRMISLDKQWTSISSIAIADDPELLRLAARSGCKGIYIGFETLSEAGLKDMGKFHNLKKDYREIVKRVRDAGILLTGGFLVGFDSDTPDTFERIIDFVVETDLEICQYYVVVPWPRTPFYEKLKREGRLFHERWWMQDFYSQQVLYKPANMSEEEMVQGFLYLIDQTYRLDKVVSRLWGGWFGRGAPRKSSRNGLKNRKDKLLQRIGALAFNLAYREVYMGQKELFKEKIGIG
jgi:radical SAM superfamily enzyme YgiQ (UPF0313 family)